MRMKDSDDYITARGANPRTGLISPSVGTRTPCTPDSPGEALRLRDHHQVSPTRHPRTRPPISRVYEGRKTSGGKARKWGVNEDGWYIESLDSSPAQQPSNQDTQARPSSSCSSHLRDDDFVVHMPSAREPQPFAYPGYSAEQIEAYEHYMDKSRRVSNEGYDRRLLHASNFSSDSPTSDAAHGSLGFVEAGDGLVVCPITGQYFRAYRDISNGDIADPPSIAVRKRHAKVDRIKQQDKDEAHKHIDGAKSGVLFAPFASPKTPATGRPFKKQVEGFPKSSPDAYPDTKHAQICSATGAISGDKVVGSAPSARSVANGDHYHELIDCKRKKTLPRLPPDSDPSSEVSSDLRKLPRVRLVRPECAALPQCHHQDERRRSNDGGRQCALGCEREASNGECVGKRNSSTSTVRRISPLENEPSTPPPKEQAAASSPHSDAEIALSIFEALLRFIMHIEIPKSGQMGTLMSSDVPTKDRVEALKAVVSVAAHALAICTILAMLWKLGSAAMHLLEVLLWPLEVPFRVFRWLTGCG
ncbi:Hypothetical predicted protein [Lecanosticta acicola]|uniref:Uncharacterized protein n=1 Tax=Lecanosticta acicola TaxID=111012 RepID=A0AAI9EDE7_9PEZI|nr:Hypothetical predicted protein [Lecanosticta acicola]